MALRRRFSHAHSCSAANFPVAVRLHHRLHPGAAPGYTRRRRSGPQRYRSGLGQVIAAKDFEKFMGYYADDASVLMPNAPAINGKDAIRAAFKPFFDDPNFAMTFQGSRFEVAKSG